jgi:hypothetical protein
MKNANRVSSVLAVLGMLGIDSACLFWHEYNKWKFESGNTCKREIWLFKEPSER